ncbi:MAG: amidase family protein [Reyranella sp.]|nr:amidase family protein [Reyranella sp.]MDP3160445.1 amidase family protein [Reyranella sp.]
MELREYTALTAVEMAELVRRRTVSPVELTQAALGAIEETEPKVNGYGAVFAADALAQAQVLETEARAGKFRGVFHGVPIGIKDLFLTKGVKTQRGSRMYAESVPTETAPAVERMLAAGAIMVGKTTTPEFGWKAASTSPLYGVTRNPWDVSRTAGGSSSGSAVAVADGSVPLTLGSDGGGSMRVPAAFCGIFTLKATLGRVPTYPLSPSEHLSHAGPMTNSVADYALALDVLQGPDERDPQSLADSPVSYHRTLGELPKGLRCMLAPTLFGRAVAPGVASVIAQAFAEIRAHLPVEVIDGEVDWADPIDVFDGLWVARGALYSTMKREDKDRLDPGFARMIDRAPAIRLEDHLRTLQARAAFNRQVAESFRAFDLLLVPMAPVEPFAAEADGPADMDPSVPVPWARWTPFSYPFNLTGQPAATVPCGWSPSGLPVGLQVIGRRFEEDTVLQFCAAWEKHFDWRRRKPAVFAGS